MGRISSKMDCHLHHAQALGNRKDKMKERRPIEIDTGIWNQDETRVWDIERGGERGSGRRREKNDAISVIENQWEREFSVGMENGVEGGG